MSNITVTLTVNGKQQSVTAAPDTPLLWVLREQLKLTGTKASSNRLRQRLIRRCYGCCVSS